MLNITDIFFQFHRDNHPCGDSYSDIIFTNAALDIIAGIIKDINSENKLKRSEKDKAVLDILKARGYEIEIIKQKVFTIE